MMFGHCAIYGREHQIHPFTSVRIMHVYKPEGRPFP